MPEGWSTSRCPARAREPSRCSSSPSSPSSTCSSSAARRWSSCSPSWPPTSAGRPASATCPGSAPTTSTSGRLVVVATQGHGDEEALELVRPRAAGVPRPGRLAQARRRRCWSTSPSAACRRTLLDRVHTPVGLDLGHTSHREIAVAVLAELVQLRAAGAFATRGRAAPAPRAGGHHRGDRPGVRDDRDRRRVRLVGQHRTSTTGRRTTSAASAAATGSPPTPRRYLTGQEA